MATPSTAKLNLFSFKGNIRVLHLSWVAFFVSFFVWFNHAPLMGAIREAMNLTDQEVKTLLILNVALTIPARIIIGMTVDKFGPRIVYTLLLATSGILCFMFAVADSFQAMAITRFLLGFVGAGFVIGIRMIGEWFPARHVGLAEGIYGGWGNFGSAAAAMSLPITAQLIGGADGWRYAIAMTGVIALIYAVIYYRSVSDTPKGSTYFQPKKSGALEVTSKGDFFFYIVMKAPLFLALALLNWKLGASNLDLYPMNAEIAAYAFLVILFAYQIYHIYAVNKGVFTKPVAKIHRYSFKQVAVLDLAYLVTFGSELAVVSMLPLFFLDTFELTPVMAGLLASGFAFMNLIARPGGGLASDLFGRKKTLIIFLTGLSVGYLTMSQIDSSWWLPAAVGATMACSFFVQAGEGAVFAMVPLIKRRQTGQIAGMVGAYGNVGAVVFLTILSFVSTDIFFMVIAGAAIVTMIAIVFLLDEPEGHMAEVMPDGTVELIEVT